MTKGKDLTIAYDPWHPLTQLTPARIALGRAGTSIPTRANLDFQLAHALARDAVHIPLDFDALKQSLYNTGYMSQLLQSQAESQAQYLQRPDYGRCLSKPSIQKLTEQKKITIDIVIVIADGLSSKAIANHALTFLQYLVPSLTKANYQLAPISLVKHGRVAIGDPIAEHYNAPLCITLIGERPGLSSPDSMGIYFTYQAKANISTDADRNCISNIHANGLSYEHALKKLLYLINQAEKLELSGVALKDETTESNINTNIERFDSTRFHL